MAKLIWTEKSIESLETIYDYISCDSIQYANYQTRKIVESVERLSIFPESGKTITEAFSPREGTLPTIILFLNVIELLSFPISM